MEIKMKTEIKFYIAAIVCVVIPFLVAMIDLPFLHGRYGLVAIVFCLVGLLLAIKGVSLNRKKYYSKLTVADLKAE